MNAAVTRPGTRAAARAAPRALTRAWQALTLRARLLLIGVSGLATAIAVGSFALYGVLTLVSYRTLDDDAAATAAEVVSLIEAGRLPNPIPVTGSQIVQVVDARDRVVSASFNADRLTALLLPEERSAALAGEHPEVSGSRIGLDSALRVTAVEAGPAGARRTVVVAQQFEDIEDSQRTLQLTLLATYPFLLAVLALIAWRVVGAALGPVEALRSAADRISGTGQDARLPVPSSGDEVHALAVTLNSMLDRLAASRARQRAFVADAAHELRSPLASMQTQLEIAERLGEGGEVSRDLRAEVLRMTALVEDLLVLARVDGDTRPHRSEPVALRPLLAEVSERYAAARVPVALGEVPDVMVLGQHVELARLLANLVDNAVRHAASSVRLAARVDASPDLPEEPPAPARVEVSVLDDGAGIPAPDRERVFERFTRLDDARARDAGGSGLGLAIVAELVRRNGGIVRLGDAPGGGLAVHVLLPLAAPTRDGEVLDI
ncbi:MAG TPA: HAMP domain-containing sensor histidine kinase [Nocardioidaceae bacterium]|nr:HAMP domain-containing sensor histidine kinase [Nocardioidaceae bacterium]